MVGLHPLQEVANAAALELKNAFCFASAEQCKRGSIVQRKGERIDFYLSASGMNDFDCLGHNGEITQAQEVHLHEPCMLDIVHGPLRDHILLASHSLQRHIFHERPVGDDNGRSMGADIACKPLDPSCQIHKFPHLRIRFAGRYQLRPRRCGLLQRDAQLVGHHCHDRVHAGDRHSQGASHIADRCPGGQRAERADLSHIGLAILLLHIFDHLAPPLFAEVDIDIGGLPAVDVEKAFKEQVVFKWAHVREIERVGHQRTHARSSRCSRNALLTGVPNEIPHDQEIT